MNRKHGMGIGLIFAIVTVGIMLLSVLLIGFVMYLFFRHGVINLRESIPFFPLIGLLLISLLLSMVLSLIVNRMILRPVQTISEAAKQVAKGDFTGLLTERHNVRELGEISRNFNLMIRELASIETLRTDFVVNVSHEFKTPLSCIEGCAMLLQDDGLSGEERGNYTNMILDSARQLSTLTGNILRLSKLENQEIIAEKEGYRLDEQIRQTILLLETQWSAKNILFNLELEKTEYYGNPQLMQQIWINIIGNAIKFSPDQGEIAISLLKEAGTIRVVVADNGIGMSAEVMRHVFNKFYQGDLTRTESGNGLGLALAKRIADLCGGRIEVESALGAGSIFTVTLPAVQQDAQGVMLTR